MNFVGIGFGSRLVRGRRSLHGSSARRAIMMPALSPFMTQGTISRWLKKEGEEFQVGDILLQIESEYDTIYVEAENPGILRKILSPDGSTNVPIEQVIALVSKIPAESVHTQAPTPISTSLSQHTHLITGDAAIKDTSSLRMHNTTHSNRASALSGARAETQHASAPNTGRSRL
ncbi:Dihydrolipoyllysine-residue acetyltransferase [Mycena sanguinolenta]|uniref:Dihydrolipoyllysine-residue acetyltransferase n=1 Tax=Mycena sanguinolenta TaxID=230812 RepID=A0A8H7D522_9AGAR|nr:Dihydrolipoyllysine-residue acetyltransferase [Mycena sanguinolenta]